MNTLPPIPDITRLSKGVIRILGQNGPSKFVLQGTNTYLIGTGRERILLDTGEGEEAYLPLLSSVLASERCTVSKILLSHWHHDHVAGLPSVLALLERDHPSTSSSSSGPQVLKFPHEDDEAGWTPLRDGEEIRVEGARLRAIHTPGHTTDHLTFHSLLPDDEDDVLFTGDHVLGGSTSVFEDLGRYMASLQKLQALRVATLYPGHGAEIRDGVRVVGEYIRHRQGREDEIVAALQRMRSGTAMEIVQVVYKDVREDLHLAAENGVRQHLEKLAQERRVSLHDGARWRLTDHARI